MVTRYQLGPERLVDNFIAYLFENYAGSRHVRRVASWVGLIVLAIDRNRRRKGTLAQKTVEIHIRRSGFQGQVPPPSRCPTQRGCADR